MSTNNGQVEVVTLRRCYIGGEVREVGYVASLPVSDAVYLAGIGRVEVVDAAAPVEVAEEAAPVEAAEAVETKKARK